MAEEISEGERAATHLRPKVVNGPASVATAVSPPRGWFDMVNDARSASGTAWQILSTSTEMSALGSISMR